MLEVDADCERSSQDRAEASEPITPLTDHDDREELKGIKISKRVE